MERRLDPNRIEMVDHKIAEILRKKEIWERVQMAFEANDFVRQIVEASVRNQRPDWDDDSVMREVAKRMCGEAIGCGEVRNPGS